MFDPEAVQTNRTDWPWLLVTDVGSSILTRIGCSRPSLQRCTSITCMFLIHVKTQSITKCSQDLHVLTSNLHISILCEERLWKIFHFKKKSEMQNSTAKLLKIYFATIKLASPPMPNDLKCLALPVTCRVTIPLVLPCMLVAVHMYCPESVCTRSLIVRV